jgi:hypothetical protein
MEISVGDDETKYYGLSKGNSIETQAIQSINNIFLITLIYINKPVKPLDY